MARVFLGQPYYPGSMQTEAMLACLVYAGKKHHIEYTPVCTTGTCKTFNIIWAEALSRGERGEIDYFAMLHADVLPEANWIDTLIDECDQLQADMVSAVIPIKDMRGLTSTGVDWEANNPWEVRRLAMAEILALPETFSIEELTAHNMNPNGQPLLVNTGCWVADMRRPFWYEEDAKHEAFFFFTMNDAIVHIAPGKWVPKTESEDWFISRRLGARGAKVFATRKVVVHHRGAYDFPNNVEWGQCKTDESRPGMIHEHGYWTVPTEILHKHDAPLADALAGFLAGSSVLDMGCGRGDYVMKLRQAGIDANGVDGNPYTEEMSGGVCRRADLAEPLNGEPVDWVLSLEVAEHIPKQFEADYLDNLNRHARKGIVVSWAVPGQAGTGHYNERPPEYVGETFTKMGFQENVEAGERLRAVSTLPWFQQNLRVFERAEKCV